MHKSQSEDIHQNKMKLVRKFAYFILFSNFYYQLVQIKKISNP